jgi:HK97 family phage major capsid protein
MSYTSNRTLLEKADLALADLTAGGGILLPAQAQKFMRLLIKQSVLMQLATVVPMASPKHQLSKIKFGSRILRPGQEATALAVADRARPDLSFLELDARLFKAEVHLSDEVLEDNIERGELRQTILEMIAEAAGRDMEEVIINGDTASADAFLATMDGLLKQATSHVVDAAGVGINKNLLRDMLKSLPSEYLRDKKQMAFLTSVDAELDYRNTLADRATVGGDRFIEEDTPALYSGVPVKPVPLFPENLGQANNRTVALLCNPKNVHVGIWRQIRLESFRDVSAGVLRVVATLRFDAKFAEEPGVA